MINHKKKSAKKSAKNLRVIDLADGANIKSINRKNGGNSNRAANSKVRFVDKDSEANIKALSVMVQSNIDKSLRNKNSILDNFKIIPKKEDTNINLFDSVKINGDSVSGPGFDYNYDYKDPSPQQVSRSWFDQDDFVPSVNKKKSDYNLATLLAANKQTKSQNGLLNRQDTL